MIWTTIQYVFCVKIEVSLFMEVEGGEVSGPKMTLFILPPRWTKQNTEELRQVYINRKSSSREHAIKQLYYKHYTGKNVG